MGEKMRPIPFQNLMEWSLQEYNNNKSVFGVREDKFYRNTSGKSITIFNETISSPIGPAAGPNSQLAQNILVSYLAGSRFMELKTVQIMDGEELSACVPRPCINAEDECYNVEWSTELTVPQAYDEYVKAWFAIQVLAKEFGISEQKDFAYNMSVGYDLAGIQSPKVDKYIEEMKEASHTEIWAECTKWLKENIDRFEHFTLEDLEQFSTQICSSVTLSTLHGCPPDEIERIAKYLLDEKKIHTYVKCNPTLLGYEKARSLLDEMGYGYVSFDEHHFLDDLQYDTAISMFNGLMEFASERNLSFGVKITNTFPVEIKRNELPGEEMYMSGRALYPLSLTVAAKLSQDFNGKLPVSYSGGADAFNIESIYKTGIQPITVATTLLKPGGYERFHQLAEIVEPLMQSEWPGIDKAQLSALAGNLVHSEKYRKDFREVGSRKTDVPLGLFDCYQAPCKQGGCPIEQQIPEYLQLVADQKYRDAFDVIAIDNTAPSITGTICDHNCQSKCTRVDYDSTLEIRDAKLTAAEAAQEAFIQDIQVPALRTDKKAVVVGAGPAGVAAALFLRRNGVDVTVLEKNDRPYGIVEYIIPSFRISSAAIKRDFEMAERLGVKFIFNVDAKCDVQALKNEYDFVILAIGAWKAGRSPVQEGYENMRDALDFLWESKANDCNVNLGKRVAIIGGGDVAMDCSRAAKRAPGVEQVSIVYRRTVDFMPAEPEEIRLAKGDGVVFQELLGPISYDGNTLVCEKTELTDYDESGRRGVQSTGERVELQFDTVICAVGAQVDQTLFVENDIAHDKRKVILNAAGESSIENVYIAGDCVKGPATVVRAIADAKQVAMDILTKLNLSNDFERIQVTQPYEELYRRKGILESAHHDYSDGNRCLECDRLCEICADVCPNRANVVITLPGYKNRHQIVHIDGMCNECGNCGVFCPHADNPYKDKVTVFWTEEDFVDSTNVGYFQKENGQYMFRLEDRSVVTVAEDSPEVPAELWEFVHVIAEKYAYYLV